MENILKPKICFIGAGNVSEHHIKAAKNNGFELHGICGREGSLNAKKIAKKYNFNTYWQSVEEINTDQIDALSIIVNPPNLINVYKKFEKTNLAILIEKPVALDSRVIQLLNSERSRTMVAFNRRYYSSVNRFKKDLSELHHFQGHANLSELSWAADSSNKEKIEFLKLNGIHFFDLFLYLFGKPKSIDFKKIVHKDKILGGSFIIDLGYDKIITLNINFGIPNNHSLEVYSESKVFQLKPLEVFSKIIGMKHETIGKSENKSYVPVLEIDWELSKQDISHKAGFIEMYNTFLRITRNENVLNFPNLKDAKNALEFAENIEFLLGLN
jgi:predicted dehydrogenase